MIDQYREAVERHRQRVYSFAHYSLRAAEDAEDVTQDVFIKLWRNWRRIDHGKLSAWLMRVAHNAVIDHVRKQKRRADVVDQYQDVEQQAEGQGGQHGQGGQGDESAAGAYSQPGGQMNQVDHARLRQSLQRAVRELRDPFRSIIIMRDIQGHSYSDIEQSLELSSSQVKVYLHRARRKLREDPELRELFMVTVKDAEG